MAMSKINVGVIGTGHLGKLHIKQLLQVEQANLVGIYDSNVEMLAAAAKEFEVKPFTKLAELLSEVQAVSIAATTTAHYELALEALNAGVHVFVEKPITAKIEEAEELVMCAREKGLILQVGHIERYNPALLALEHYQIQPLFVQSDRLAQFNPRGTDVAVVLDLMIHDIDIILSLVKSEVKSVSASGISVVSDSIDIANARIEFENGAVANVTASRISMKKMRKMRLFKQDMYVTVDFTNGSAEIFRLAEDNMPLSANVMAMGEIGAGDHKKTVVFEQPPAKEVNALLYELSHFVDCIQTGTQPKVTGEDGLRALKVAEEIIRKIEQQNLKIISASKG